MKTIIAEEVAREEIALWQEALETELSEDEIQAMLPTIMRGRVIFDEQKESFKITLRSPIQLENGSSVDFLEIREPTAEELENANKVKDEMAMSMRLFQALSGHPIGVIRRMKQRDMIALSSIFVFFA
jgi:hypothetical protein